MELHRNFHVTYHNLQNDNNTFSTFSVNTWTANFDAMHVPTPQISKYLND